MGRLQDNQYTSPSKPKKKLDDTKIKEERAINEAKLQETFCPPLDPSLIQAIWNDSYNYDSVFKVLVALAKEADLDLDQQEIELSMEKLEMDESEATTSVATTTTTESEDENFNFLFACFPTLSTQELLDALESQDNDVEKATDVLLNREYIQQVEHNDGIELERKQTDQVQTRQQKQSQNKKKQQKQQQSKKKGTIWSSGQLPIATPTPVHNNSDNVWGTVTPNKPFALDGSQQDPYDGLASVPFNVWHQYDVTVNNLHQQYFATAPKNTIAACVQHCRGNIIASVKMLMEKLPNEKPEHHMAWPVVKELTIVKHELETIMEDRSAQDVANVSIGLMIKYEGQEKTTDQLVQAGVEHFLTFDVSQIQLEARLKQMAKESEMIRAKAKKKEIPVIPEYLLLNNQNDYVEDDPEECRDIAMQLILERNELFRKAAAAYRQARNKGPGEGGVAFYYSDTARQIDSQAKDWNMRAARATVRGHRIKQNDDNLLDLHGLTVAEAQVLLKEGITQWWSRSQMQSARRQIQPLKIITGIGKHSQYGESKLLPSALKFLRKEGWLFETGNPGCILVKGVAKQK